MSEIRPVDLDRDRDAVRRWIVALQEVERALDPRMPPGEQMADRYLERMLERNAKYGGALLVAVVAEEVVGFVNVWTRYRSDEPDDDPAEHAYVSDLVVSDDHRGTGLGRALLQAAEGRAREAGAAVVRLSVKCGNTPALGLYGDEGYRESAVHLEKLLP